MWIISVLIVVPVAWLAIGREVPNEVQDLLETRIAASISPASDVLAYSFIIGLFVGGTPIHVILRYLATLVHELGHAVSAGILGGRPKQIMIHPSSSGVATYQPPIGWGKGRASVVSLAGYPSPAIASLAAVQALLFGLTSPWFLFVIATLALSIVFFIRNLWGLLWTTAVVVGAYFATTELSQEILQWVVGVAAGYLAMEGLRHAGQQISIARRFPGSGCDAERVGVWWSVPPVLVAVSQFLFVGVAAGLAAYLAIEPQWDEIFDIASRWTS